MQRDAEPITWRLHLRFPPHEVYHMLTTKQGRERFWAEEASERDGVITFRFSDGTTLQSRILAKQDPHRFTLTYFDDSRVTFLCDPDGHGGTDLTLRDDGVPAERHAETRAGWVSVLLALKAAVDLDVDLRNHDPERTWAQGFVDN